MKKILVNGFYFCAGMLFLLLAKIKSKQQSRNKVFILKCYIAYYMIFKYILYISYILKTPKYIKELLLDIKISLPTRLHKPAPKYFNQYGNDMKYAGFKKNRNTTWYVFFETYEENEKVFYLVRYIANNHVIAQYL